jgi:hypothetical protein
VPEDRVKKTTFRPSLVKEPRFSPADTANGQDRIFGAHGGDPLSLSMGEEEPPDRLEVASIGIKKWGKK